MEEALNTRAFNAPAGTHSGDALLAEAAKTDAGAFGELYERYYARVYRYVYHRLGNAPDAEDVTALVFMKALEAMPAYQSTRSSFAPWLFRIARNAVIDHYRRGRKHSPIDEVELHSTDGNPALDVLNAERRAELRALVEHLSDDQRDVVLMRYSADLSFPEIATTLNKNEPAVRMLLHRGLRKLKAVMDDV
ncbi:MAG: RNA polymerase sigma factor [Chloroflexota bacterium]|nr:RNA polymerase sigma factor [Chloroflexota bacterium]